MVMTEREYLVSHGSAGDFGRFRAAGSLPLQRGDRVVVRSQLGLELGVVMCAATERHARMLEQRFVGDLLRRAGPEDEQAAEQMRERGQRLFEDGRRLLAELDLPLELLDVEVLLDGRHATLHHVRWGECDERPFLSTLSQRHEVQLALQDLVVPASDRSDEGGGCGKPDCGRGAGGSCDSCGTGGSCSTGCGSAAATQEVLAYFAGLREKMENRHRTPLL